MISRNDLESENGKLVLGVCVFLVAITWIVFGQTLSHDFINYDDREYIFKYPQVTKGLTSSGIAWAFTHTVSYNWHPLTMVTHMVDCQLYRVKAGGHHFTNVALHTLAALLLFLVLRAMTGSSSPLDKSVSPRRPDRTASIWPSAFVAALFAIHPLHVESVAWVAERKDVLSGVFFMVTLAAYLHYTRRPSIGRYVLVALLFVLGLMSKPMLVTVPIVLLLLDYWPLGRFHKTEVRCQRSEVGGEERSKRPTLNAQRSTSNEESSRRSPAAAGRRRELKGAYAPAGGQHLILEKIPLLMLSAVSCWITILAQQQAMKSIEHMPPLVRIYNAVMSCFAYIRQMFWPDKLALFYPYPSGRLLIWPPLFVLVLLIVVTAIAWRVRKERPYILTGWLWYLVMLLPVIGLVQVGSQARADRYTYLPQIGLYIPFTWTVLDLSTSWPRRRKILSFLALIAIAVLGWRAWIQTSYWKNSESIWTRTLVVMPSNAFAHANLGNLALKDRQFDLAIFHFQEALKSEPKQAVVHAMLRSALLGQRRVRESVDHYEKALAIAPQWAAILNDFAWLLATCPDERLRNGPRAVELAEKANKVGGSKYPFFVRTLAAAYAESGRFSEAITAAERALQFSIAQGDTVLTSKLRMDIDLYRLNFPLRDWAIRTEGN